MVSKVENRFFESTGRPLEFDFTNRNPLEGAGYLPFCNTLDSFVSVALNAALLLCHDFARNELRR
jgi:hypothetical protein